MGPCTQLHCPTSVLHVCLCAWARICHHVTRDSPCPARKLCVVCGAAACPRDLVSPGTRGSACPLLRALLVQRRAGGLDWAVGASAWRVALVVVWLAVRAFGALPDWLAGWCVFLAVVRLFTGCAQRLTHRLARVSQSTWSPLVCEPAPPPVQLYMYVCVRIAGGRGSLVGSGVNACVRGALCLCVGLLAHQARRERLLLWHTR